jgi:two-component system OmpR family response regulator
MHHKAFDYIVKSETAFLRLEKVIATIALEWYMERKVGN